MSLPDFIYRRPASLVEALEMLATQPGARALAGGQTMIPALKQRLSRPSALVDLQGIAEMRGVDIGPQAVTIGALTPHAVTASHPGIRKAIPALSKMAGGQAAAAAAAASNAGVAHSGNQVVLQMPGWVFAVGLATGALLIGWLAVH